MSFNPERDPADTDEANPVVATRRTYDGVTVFLHRDGALSTRTHHLRARLPVDGMFRRFDDLCLYDFAELADFARTKTITRRRPSADESAAIMAANARRRVAKAWEAAIYDRSVKLERRVGR